MTMLLAEYLSHRRRKRTAVLELSGKCDFEKYEKQWYGKIEAGQIFWKKRCAYWKAASEEALREQAEYRKEYCILDLGSDFCRSAQLFACQKKLILGDCGMAAEEEMKEFLARPGVERQLSLEQSSSWIFLCNHGTTGRRGAFFPDRERGTKKICVWEVGTEPVFPVSRSAADLFEKVI